MSLLRLLDGPHEEAHDHTKESRMRKKPELKSWSAKQAVAILAVDNITLSDHGYDLLKRVEDGLITSKQAKEEILNRARARASAATK